MNLQEIKYLIHEGDYEDALEEINKSDENEIDLLILESITYRKKSKWKIALNIARDALQQSIDGGNPIQKMGAQIQVIYCEIFTDAKSFEKIIQALENYKNEFEGLPEVQQKESDEWMGYYYHLLGVLAFWNFKHDEANEFHLKSIKIREQLKPPLEILSTLNNLCSMYNQLQEVNKLEKYTQKLFEAAKNNESILSMANMYLALIKKFYGHYDEAIEYLNKAKLLTDAEGNSWLNHGIQMYSGTIEEYFTHYEDAIKHFNKAAEIAEELNENVYAARNLQSLILLYLRINNIKLAERCKARINRLIENHGEVKFRKKLANGLILKKQTNARDRLTAQDLFQEIIDEGIDRPDLIIEAKLHLTELLLDEWKLYGEDEILIKIETHIADMYEIAQELERTPLLVDVLLLRSKFAFLQLDPDLSSKILEQTRLLAEENDLKFKLPKIIEVENDFQREVDMASELTRKGYKIQERLEKSRIIEYLEDMQSLIRIGN